MDNWKDYFEDNLIVEHKVEKNNFGEVTYEADESHYTFGVKPEYKMVGLYNVAFKFDGRKYCERTPYTRYFDDEEKEYQFWKS